MVLVVAVLAALLSGCQSDYNGETTLFPDGSVERSIFQPVDSTPAEAQQDAVWKTKEVAPYKPKPSWQGERPYIKAEGKFPSVRELPNSLRIQRQADEKVAKLAPLLPSGKLARRYERVDYVFVVEHRWAETLTDTVTYPGLRQGREELADFAIRLAEDIFQEALGKDYDATALFKWLRTDGKAWLADVTDYAFVQVLTLKGGTLPPDAELAEAIINGFADICARYGLELRAHGKLLAEPELKKATEEFAINLLCRNIRRKDTGKPVDKETVLAWLAELNDPKKVPPGKPQIFEPAAKKVIQTKYGGEEVLLLRVAPSLFKITGAYWIDPLHFHMFDYKFTPPGLVVQTNGEILSDNRVRWHFNAHAAWPNGFTMACRSLEAQMPLQKSLLKGQPLDSREAMLDFVALMAKNKPSRSAPDKPSALLEILKRCREQKTLAPLADYRKKLTEKGDKAELAEVDQLLKLLKLSAEALAGD
jgi:hypothetical protein